MAAWRRLPTDEGATYDEQELLAIMANVEERAYRAAAVEKEALDYWMLVHLESQVGSVVDAVVLDDRGAAGRAEVVLESVGWRTRVRMTRPVTPGSRVPLRIEQVRPRAGVLVLSEA